MTTRNRIIPIDWIDQTERCAVIGGYERSVRKPRLKEFHRAKGNCHFTGGIPRGLLDFTYRAVVKLGLRTERFFFSRGAVKRNGRSLVNTVALRRLDWDVGISVIIPQRLRYSSRIRLSINGHVHDLRVMELALLMTLLSLRKSDVPKSRYADLAAAILAEGWLSLDSDTIPDVSLAQPQEGSRGVTKGSSTIPAKRPQKKPAP